MAVAINLGADGALLDYSDLVEKVKLWLDRGSELDTYIPTFISLAESYLNRTLRTPQMETSVALVGAGPTFALPQDFLQARSVMTGYRTLTAMTPQQLLDAYGSLVGPVCAYAIANGRISVAPRDNQQLTLNYWARIPALTAGNPTNWLFADSPDVYLYGALLQAEAYIDNPDRVAQWTTAFDACVDQLVTAGNKARYGGPLVARSPVRAIGGVRA